MSKPKPVFRYAVTFESPETAPPLTIRGTVSAIPGAALRRAFLDAKRQAPGKQWSNVLVLLERERSTFHETGTT